MIHELKCENPHFTHIWNEYKTFELRFNDRNYKLGHELWLNEYIPNPNGYEGQYLARRIKVKVIHTMTYNDFPSAIMPGWIIMSISIIAKLELSGDY